MSHDPTAPVRTSSSSPLVVPVDSLRLALYGAAECGAWAAIAYAFALRLAAATGAVPGARTAADRRAEMMAEEVEERVDHWCATLGDARSDDLAPLAWAMQEIAEWMDASARHAGLGEDDVATPLTWLPEADSDGHLSTSSLVDQRLRLLCRELSDYGVVVVESDAMPRPLISSPAAVAGLGDADGHA